MNISSCKRLSAFRRLLTFLGKLEGCMIKVLLVYKKGLNCWVFGIVEYVLVGLFIKNVMNEIEIMAY